MSMNFPPKDQYHQYAGVSWPRLKIVSLSQKRETTLSLPKDDDVYAGIT